MATIQKRGNTYRFTVSVGYDMDGKQIRKTTTYTPKAKTPKAMEKEAKDAARDFEKAVKEGQCLTGDKLTFEQFTELYYRPQWAGEQLTLAVQEQYYDLVRRWAYPAFKTMKINKVTPLHIQTIIDNMIKKGLAPKTVKKAFTAINSVFRYAYQMKVIQENPCARVSLPKLQQDTALHYFTAEQAKTFLNAVLEPRTVTFKAHDRVDDTGKPYSVKSYTETYIDSYQYYVLFTLAIYGGFRRGELVAMQWRDIDFEQNKVSVRRAAAKVKGGQIIKEPKTKKSARQIIMPANCFTILKEWKRQQEKICVALGSQWQGKRGSEYDENYIFIQVENGSAMYLDTPGRKFGQIINRYNRGIDKAIQEGEASEADKLPAIRFHDLRHTSATLLISEGVDIETIAHRMGHAHASTTLDIYGHALPDKDAEASAKLEMLFG